MDLSPDLPLFSLARGAGPFFPPNGETPSSFLSPPVLENAWLSLNLGLPFSPPSGREFLNADPPLLPSSLFLSESSRELVRFCEKQSFFFVSEGEGQVSSISWADEATCKRDGKSKWLGPLFFFPFPLSSLFFWH